MPKYDLILNLPGFSISKVSGYQPLLLDVVYKRLPRCGHCQSKSVRKKSSYIRTVAHELIGHRRSVLRFKAYKLYCNRCHRYGNQQFPGINKHQRATWRAQAAVFHEHTRGVSQKDLSEQYKKGKATIERWYQRQYQEQNKELLNRPCPIVLGVDEHFFSQRKGFATTFCDLRKHKIFDIVPGRRESDLKAYLQQLPGREKVQVVCIDLSSTYRALIKKYFPNAKIVADRFHVIRLINQLSMQTFHQIDPTMKYQRGTLTALKTKPENLTPTRLSKRNSYLEQQPAIAAIYDFKQELHQLLCKKHCTAKECKRLLPRFLEMVKALKQSAFQRFCRKINSDKKIEKSWASLGRTIELFKNSLVFRGVMLRFTEHMV